MASFQHHRLLAFLLLFGVASLQAQARESQFFGKTVRYEAPKEIIPTPKETPAGTMEEPAKFPPQTQNSYGLYGRGRGHDQLPPTTTTDNFYSHANNVPSRFPNNELAGESYENKESNELTGGSYYKAMESNARYRADPSKPYGMSDTRYLENGRYFYDVNAEGYPNGYEKTRGNHEGYGEGARVGNNGYRGYSYGAKGNANEFNNEMDGYKNNQENQESPEDYVP